MRFLEVALACNKCSARLTWGAKLIRMGVPGTQKLEICNTAGPLRPRWVKSKSSAKLVLVFLLPVSISTGSAKPANDA